MIEAIEDAAVAKNAPKSFAKGAGSATVVVVVAALAGRTLVERRRAAQRESDQAKGQLRAVVIESTGVEDLSADDDLDGTEPTADDSGE